MPSANPKPKWWQLYLTFLLLVILFALDARLRLSAHEHEAVQIGIVLLVYGLIHFWLKDNRIAFSRLDEREAYGRITVIEIPPDRLPAQEGHEQSIFQIPNVEMKGMLGDTFEMDVIDARALPVEENSERAQQEEK